MITRNGRDAGNIHRRLRPDPDDHREAKIACAFHAGWRGVLAESLRGRPSIVAWRRGPRYAGRPGSVDRPLLFRGRCGAGDLLSTRYRPRAIMRGRKARARLIDLRGIVRDQLNARDSRARTSRASAVHAMRNRALLLASRRGRKDHRLADELRGLAAWQEGMNCSASPRRDFPCYSYLVERRFDADAAASPSCSPSRSGRG